MRKLLIVLALVVALLAPTPALASGVEDWPRCGTVWKVGKRLPRDYEGCQTPSSYVPMVSWKCTNGKRLTGYRDKWWAFLGQKISKNQRKYERAYWRCVGD